ncbi:MAG: hypothetical protein ACK5OX_07310 [Desertimonas sp.]
MIFGGDVTAAPSDGASTWVRRTTHGEFGTVGGFIPEGLPATVRIAAPDPDIDHWWDRYRALHAHIVAVGAEHTSTPDRAWFAVWEGHGWANQTTMYRRVADPVSARRRVAGAWLRWRSRHVDRRRNRAVAADLAALARLDLRHRRYLLCVGPLTAVTELREPGSPDTWQRPDLWWPEDRSWFVATDTDFWSLYLGAGQEMVDALVDRLPTSVTPVARDHRIERED